MSEARCSDLSRAAGEQLAATATVTESWLLVEVRGGWSRDVSTSEALPAPARESVTDWLERTPRSRLLYVRRPGRTSGPSLAFVVEASEASGAVRRFEVDELEELSEVDLAGGEVSEAPLVLVCGHGSRDACCAVRGTATFGALAPTLGDEMAWISSHQGGHRFAANVLVLPAAVQLGRVEPEEARDVVIRALAGEIDLVHYRGRAVHEPVVQAAEHAIRAATGFGRVADLRFVGSDGATVRFCDADGVEHVAEVAEVPGPTVPVSCGAGPEQQPAYEVRLLPTAAS